MTYPSGAHMDEVDVQQVVEAIGGAAWRMGLAAFCEKLEVEEDDYWKSKFVEFQDMARSLGRFDSATLYKIIR